MKELAGECPTGTVGQGPGEEVGISPAGLGTCRGLEGEFANSPPGDGWGSMLGEGFMFGGREGGDAKLKDAAGLEPKLWCWLAWNIISSTLLIKIYLTLKLIYT